MTNIQFHLIWDYILIGISNHIKCLLSSLISDNNIFSNVKLYFTAYGKYLKNFFCIFAQTFIQEEKDRKLRTKHLSRNVLFNLSSWCCHDCDDDNLCKIGVSILLLFALKQRGSIQVEKIIGCQTFN